MIPKNCSEMVGLQHIVAVVRLPRPIALATWQNLQYALLRYYKDQPGLHFGVVLLSSCKKKWLEKVVVGSYVTSKSAHLNVEGIVQVNSTSE